jgi:hypothetical protein
VEPGADIAVVALKKIARLIAVGAVAGCHAFLCPKHRSFNRYIAAMPVVIGFLGFWNRYKLLRCSGLNIAKMPVIVGL